MAPKKTYTRTETFQNGRDTAVTFILFFSISAMVHLIFFTALFFSPDIRPKRNFSIAAINVNLVTLADPGTFKKSIDNNKEVKNLKKAVAHLVQAVKCSKPIDARHTEHLAEAENLLK